MKRTLSSLSLFVAATMPFAVPSAFGQGKLPDLPHHWPRLYIVQPLKDATRLRVINYSIVSPVNGETYSGQMVGRSLFFRDHRSTSVLSFVSPQAILPPAACPGGGTCWTGPASGGVWSTSGNWSSGVRPLLSMSSLITPVRRHRRSRST